MKPLTIIFLLQNRWYSLIFSKSWADVSAQCIVMPVLKPKDLNLIPGTKLGKLIFFKLP